MARSTRVTCVFCGERKLEVTAPVIPRWARERLGVDADVTREVTSSGPKRSDPDLTVALRRTVCQDCDSGWMHTLEDKVSPFLGPMLVHEGIVDLGREQQRDLARWAVTNVLLLALSMRQQHPHRRITTWYKPSEPELAWLYAKDAPPPHSRVWLGAFDAQHKILMTTRAKLLSAVEAAEGAGFLPAHVSTVTIGYVLLQVYSIDYVAADARSLPAFDGSPPQPFVRALPRIWPTVRQNVRWPPGRYISENVLVQAALWARSFT
jgi:hypothetical protein